MSGVNFKGSQVSLAINLWGGIANAVALLPDVAFCFGGCFCCFDLHGGCSIEDKEPLRPPAPQRLPNKGIGCGIYEATFQKLPSVPSTTRPVKRNSNYP
jgi:hypothetical protein